MASGETVTTNLTDSLNTMLAAARIVREYKGRMPSLVTKETLKPGTGISWRETSFAAISASAVAETEYFENPQQYSDTLFSVTPSLIGVHTVVTKRVQERIASEAWGKMGGLAQNAIQRKKDEDGLTALDGASTSLSGAGTTLQSGVIISAVSRIRGNATEPAEGPVYCVLHGFQVKDLVDELIAGIGTYAIPEGETAQTFRNGFEGRIGSAEIYEDGNITIDSSDDSKGGVFAKESIVLVQGRAAWTTTRDEPSFGGGGTSIWHWDEYAYGERSAGNWLYEVYSDATAPTG